MRRLVGVAVLAAVLAAAPAAAQPICQGSFVGKFPVCATVPSPSEGLFFDGTEWCPAAAGGGCAHLTCSGAVVQLDADLDPNGNSITDGAGLELLSFIETGSAVNECSIANAATGGKVTISATGDDAAIGLDLQAKSTDPVCLGSNGETDIACASNDGTGSGFVLKASTTQPAGTPILNITDSSDVTLLAIENSSASSVEISTTSSVADQLRVNPGDLANYWIFDADGAGTKFKGSTGVALLNVVATATVPNYVPAGTGDIDTGVGRAGDDQLSHIAGSVEMMRMTEDTTSKVEIDVAGTLREITSYAAGHLYENDVDGTPANSISIANGGTYVGWTSATAGITSGGVTLDTADATADEITVAEAGDYDIFWSMSVTGSNSITMICCPHVNNSIPAGSPCQARGLFTSPPVGAFGGPSGLTLAASAEVDLRCTTLSGEDSKTINIWTASLLVQRSGS